MRLVVMDLLGVKLPLGVGGDLELQLCLRLSCGLEARSVSSRAGLRGPASGGPRGDSS